MTRTKRLLSMILALALVWVVLTPAVQAEPQTVLEQMMQQVDLPITYDLHAMPTQAGEDDTQKELALTFAAQDGQSVHVRVQMLVQGVTKLDNQWAALSEPYAEVVSSLVAGHEIDDSLPAQIDQQLKMRIAQQKQAPMAQADDAEAPAPALSGDITIAQVSVTHPYYETLQNGSKGPAAEKLQKQLMDLGFLDGEPDGQFGPKTKVGVEALQSHVRALEQQQIDASIPEPTPTPEPVVETPAADATDENPAPEATPEPTPEPLPEPQTEINGIADANLQAYLYSDQFTIAGADLGYEDKGDAVIRLQKKLKLLGYTSGEVTGFYGDATRRGVIIFQHYNNLPETGLADHQTQKLLYSKDAQKPPYPLMTEGSEGDDVKLLQQRLKQLGFMTGGVDGSYGKNTTSGIKNLQTYMKQTDETIDENGVADPMLVEAFFAADFNDFPDTMQRGDKGAEVTRLQRRLYDLEYLYYNPDGEFGDGSEKAVTEFQKRNKLEQTGVANQDTIEKLFSLDAKKALKPYVLKVSVDKQRVYAYAPDENEEYTRLVRTMKCSTGTTANPTIKGTFQATTGPGARWHYFKKYYCWAQYAYSIQGNYLFHSVLYSNKGSGLQQGSVRNLGRRASHGCVRLAVEDAKWIWTNCPKRTKVIVY